MSKIKFNKPYSPFSDQIDLLEQRGLIIADKPKAIEFLEYVNYYRLSGYMLPFELSRHVFYHGTTFDQVKNLYLFDRNLRNLVMEALAVIEVFTRTKFSSFLGDMGGPFAHLNGNHFDSTVKYQDWYNRVIPEIKRSQEAFVRHFKTKYCEWPDLPIWVTVDLLTFGSMSMFYRNLKTPLKKQLAQCFQVKERFLESWLHVLNYTRNLCAHHSRLWNRIYSIKAVIPRNDTSWNIFSDPALHAKPFLALTIISQLLHTIQSTTGIDIFWRQRVIDLLQSPPNVPNFEQATGIPPNWQQNLLWQ